MSMRARAALGSHLRAVAAGPAIAGQPQGGGQRLTNTGVPSGIVFISQRA
jgi:hypothetical protein